MADDEISISYASGHKSLADILSEVERPGDFYATGVIETPMPLLKVEGAGTVSFPVPAEQCQRLIKSAAKRAPYGRGDETLHDESVRKVWQIDADNVSLTGKSWSSTLDTLISRVEEGLGSPAKSVEIELYKLLIYDEGGFFKAHRDTEKSEGMFGTLVVSLPSAHVGGDLLIRHAGQEVRADLCAEDPSEIRYAAFYADCEHEVLPVESGNRVCLVYNLLHTSKHRDTPANAPDYRDATQAAAEQLRQWASSGTAPNKLVWLLEHKYTEAGISLAGLKNRDATLTRVLRDAAATAGCAFHLGILHIEESGWAESSGGYYGGRRGRYWDDDEDEEDEDDFEIGKVDDYDRYISTWRDAEDRVVEFGRIPLEDNEALPVGAIDSEEPDELHFSEATGNAGASFERTYLCAAVVLWPEDRTDLVCAAAGTAAAVARLGQRVTEVKQGSAEARKAIDLLTTAIEDRWKNDWDIPRQAADLFAHLARLGDPHLILRFWDSVLLENYTGTENAALADAAVVLGTEAEKPLLSLLDRHHPENAAACLDLWMRVSQAAMLNSPLQTICASVLPTLLDPLKKPISKPKNLYSHYLFNKENRIELTPVLVAGFLLAVTENPMAKPLIVATANAFDPATQHFSTDTHLLPALELAEKGMTIPEQALDILWTHCATDLLRRAEFPPTVPTDWAQNVSLGSTSSPLKELEAFARDPDRQEARFSARKDLRQILHRAIDQPQKGSDFKFTDNFLIKISSRDPPITETGDVVAHPVDRPQVQFLRQPSIRCLGLLL